VKKINVETLNYSIRINIDIKIIMNKLRKQGIINKKNRPICCNKISPLQDYQIINRMAAKASGLINFYSCVNNLWEVKQLVNYILRYSLAATLSRKFKTLIKKIFQKYGKDFNIKNEYNRKIIEIAKFPNRNKIDSLQCKFNTNIIDYNKLDKKYEMSK